MENMLEGLNAAQTEAVTTTEGYVRVIAGAGSGKTRALAYRFAYLVNAVGVLPENILCVTFTNKAAAEMKARIRSILGGNDTGYISTFHSFCVAVLQEDSHAIGYPKSFIVLDNGDIDAMLRIIYEERGLTMRDKTFGDARDMFEIRKTQKERGYYEDMLALPLEQLKAKYDAAEKTDDILFYGYLYQEKKTFALDYNDLIVFVLYIFETDAEVRKKWQARLEYIMVDEFQDIDDIQHRLMEALCAYHKNLFVVGDPDQTIYSWRGANIKYLLDFDKAFPGTKTIMMNENYRSTQEILDVANSLIAKNRNRMKKELYAAPAPNNPLLVIGGITVPTASSTLGGAPVPVYHHTKRQDDEAAWIADGIEELRAGGARYSDCAVLYRAHYVSRLLEETFARRGIPFTLYSGVQFFDREEVKDALSYLRLCVYRDDLSFARVVNKPKRNIGKSRMEAVTAFAEENGGPLYEALCVMAEQGAEILNGTAAKDFITLIEEFSRKADEMAPSELLAALINKSGYEAMLRTEGSQTRLDNLAELKQAVHEFEVSAGEDCDVRYFLARAALLSGLDRGGTNDAVKFMTVHTAKGLEFPHVFLCSMNEGIFPSRKVLTPAAMEEERRLCFVAVTRAERTLHLSDNEGRNLDGSVRYPSRFVLDVDRRFLHYDTELTDAFTAKAKAAYASFDTVLAAREQTAVLQAGDAVAHCILGRGTILEVCENDGAFLVQFENLPTPRKLRASALKRAE